MIFFAQFRAVNSPVDNLVKLSVALNAGNLNFIFKRKITVINNAQLRQLIAAARLPKDFLGFVSLCLFEIKSFSLGVIPLGNFSLIVPRLGVLKTHLELTGNNFVYAGACGVGEPSKGGTDEHCSAEHNCKRA